MVYSVAGADVPSIILPHNADNAEFYQAVNYPVPVLTVPGAPEHSVPVLTVPGAPEQQTHSDLYKVGKLLYIYDAGHSRRGLLFDNHKINV